jgi:hypothetical protein
MAINLLSPPVNWFSPQAHEQFLHFPLARRDHRTGVDALSVRA